MKFVTEEDLRDLYKKQPFTDYEIEPGTRITPGARQFLADRGINMFDDASWKNNTIKKEKPVSPVAEKKKNLCGKKLLTRLKSMDAMFLVAVEELLRCDVLLAQNIICLSKNFLCIRSAVEGESSSNNLCCKNCTGINEENFSTNMDDCFEITEFHVQLCKGKEIIILHQLRCALREIELEVLEYINDCGDENKQCEEAVKNINQIINTLSQLICSTVGGEKCQKKS